MAKINGTLYAVFAGSDKILHSNSATLNVDVDLPETTNKESGGWEGHEIHGKRNWTIDVAGFYDETGSGITPDEILNDIIARSADITCYFKPTTGGSYGWTGTGKYKSWKLDAPLEAPLGYSVAIQGNGPLAKIT